MCVESNEFISLNDIKMTIHSFRSLKIGAHLIFHNNTFQVNDEKCEQKSNQIDWLKFTFHFQQLGFRLNFILLLHSRERVHCLEASKVNAIHSFSHFPIIVEKRAHSRKKKCAIRRCVDDPLKTRFFFIFFSRLK